jgi:hypothetical protein
VPHNAQFFFTALPKASGTILGSRELEDLRKLAKNHLSYSDEQIAIALEWAELIEVTGNEQDEK